MKTYAYEREVVVAFRAAAARRERIPRRGGRMVIYIETPPHTNAVVEGVWMNGQFHHVDTVVKPAPVRFESGGARAGRCCGAGHVQHRHGNHREGSGAGQDARC